jgi:hypothetical protein
MMNSAMIVLLMMQAGQAQASAAGVDPLSAE